MKCRRCRNTGHTEHYTGRPPVGYCGEIAVKCLHTPTIMSHTMTIVSIFGEVLPDTNAVPHMLADTKGLLQSYTPSASKYCSVKDIMCRQTACITAHMWQCTVTQTDNKCGKPDGIWHWVSQMQSTGSNRKHLCAGRLLWWQWPQPSPAASSIKHGDCC